MNCPECGYSYSIVTDCRTVGSVKRVRKQCTGCNHRFTLFEVSDVEYRRLKKKEKAISKILLWMEVLKNLENEDH